MHRKPFTRYLCQIKNLCLRISRHPGDELFADKITGSLTYDAEFSCEFNGNETKGSCTKDVSVGLGVVTETPKADEIWSRLVAGPSAIFKRIFPKVGEGGAILGILDMPAATKVTYSGTGLVNAGNPEGRSGEAAELYFPHIGGISEYFLKGIQTILRPKGFGEQILSGAPGTIPAGGEIDCDVNAPDVSVPGLIDKDAFFQVALNWLGVPGTHALDCYNDTVGRALEAGINPALALWIWLHESGASNYDAGGVIDFGVVSPTPEGFVGQIEEFFARAGRYRALSPLCAGRNVNDMQAFAYIYSTGTCDPTHPIEGYPGQTAQSYYEGFTEGWSIVWPGCSVPDSPTDTSCR